MEDVGLFIMVSHLGLESQIFNRCTIRLMFALCAYGNYGEKAKFISLLARRKNILLFQMAI